MRALQIAVPIVWVAAACAGPETQRQPESASPPMRQRNSDVSVSEPQRLPDTASPSQAKLPTGYSLTDTTEWGNPVEDGQRAILRRGEVAIDTVALEFDVVPVGKDSLIFLAVRTHNEPFLPNDPSSGYESFPTEYVLWSPSSRRELRDLLPFFRSDNSSPIVTTESVMHYWGIATPGPDYRVHAMRYDFRTAHLDSLFIGVDDLASDYRYYLPTPRISDTEVVFRGHRLDRKTWQVIGQEPPSN